MPENDKGQPRPDGLSVTVPLIGVGGTWYWNPGSPSAPHVTLTGGLGIGGGGVQSVFLRKGMTSQDTLGWGTTATASPGFFPSATVNSTIPDRDGIPLPWKAKVSTIEAGVSIPGVGVTYTTTPQQLFSAIVTPAMGPEDELSPFDRSLRSGLATIGADVSPSIASLSPRQQNPFGGGMSDWNASSNIAPPAGGASVLNRAARVSNNSQLASSPPVAGAPPFGNPSASQTRMGGLPGMLAQAAGTAPSNPAEPQPGGLLGLIQEYMRNNSNSGASR